MQAPFCWGLPRPFSYSSPARSASALELPMADIFSQTRKQGWIKLYSLESKPLLYNIKIHRDDTVIWRWAVIRITVPLYCSILTGLRLKLKRPQYYPALWRTTYTNIQLPMQVWEKSQKKTLKRNNIQMLQGVTAENFFQIYYAI